MFILFCKRIQKIDQSKTGLIAPEIFILLVHVVHVVHVIVHSIIAVFCRTVVVLVRPGVHDVLSHVDVTEETVVVVHVARKFSSESSLFTEISCVEYSNCYVRIYAKVLSLNANQTLMVIWNIGILK